MWLCEPVWCNLLPVTWCNPLHPVYIHDEIVGHSLLPSLSSTLATWCDPGFSLTHCPYSQWTVGPLPNTTSSFPVFCGSRTRFVAHSGPFHNNVLPPSPLSASNSFAIWLCWPWVLPTTIMLVSLCCQSSITIWWNFFAKQFFEVTI